MFIMSSVSFSVLLTILFRSHKRVFERDPHHNTSPPATRPRFGGSSAGIPFGYAGGRPVAPYLFGPPPHQIFRPMPVYVPYGGRAPIFQGYGVGAPLSKGSFPVPGVLRFLVFPAVWYLIGTCYLYGFILRSCEFLGASTASPGPGCTSGDAAPS